MKGKVSKELRSILKDAEGRKQLKDLLIYNKSGTITVGDKSYKIATTQKFKIPSTAQNWFCLLGFLTDD